MTGTAEPRTGSTPMGAPATSLDGSWDVQRTSGLLPPMIGVHKHISGDRGETRIGPLPGLPFRVEGLSLHYLGPFRGFVDELEPEGDEFSGRALFLGRELGRFRLRRPAGRPSTQEMRD
jgi:hypothetical protein